MKKVILGIAIGILVSSVVAYAGTYLYTADEVGYTTSKNTSVNNVNAAINDLYSRISDLESSSSTVYYLGTATSYDIKTLFPEIDYTKLTSSNFLVVSTGVGGNPAVASQLDRAHWVRFWSSGSSASYNATTGIVSVSGGTVTASDDSVSISRSNGCLTYLVIGDIINK